MEKEEGNVKPTPKKHTRHVSNPRALLRKNTKGPLDVSDDDPLSSPRPPTPLKDPPPPVPKEKDVSKPLPILSPPPKDLSFLFRPEIYHTLNPSEQPPAFVNSPFAPYPSAGIPSLLNTGHFRPAALLSAQKLTASPPPTDPDEIFNLVYTRLACLTLLGLTHLAAQESRALEDLSSTFYLDPLTKQHIVPWELRVLAARLQGIGYGDLRRGIESYYDLAKDARERFKEAQKEGDDEGMKLWEERLQDLGVRVANALVETGDLGAAGRHLESLRPREKEKDANGEEDAILCARLAILALQVGEVKKARTWMEGVKGKAGGRYAELLWPLVSVAEGNYGSASAQLDALRKSKVKDIGAVAAEDTAATINHSVCLLYTGQLIKGREVLENLVDENGEASRTVLFNLSTMFELCTDRARSLKLELMDKVAGRGGNW